MDSIRRTTRTAHKRGALASAVGTAMMLAVAVAGAQAPTPVGASPAKRPDAPAFRDDVIGWQELSAQQRDLLKPLKEEWPAYGPQTQQKWLRLAERLPAMGADERARVEARMSEWARMKPAERAQARLRFQEAKQMPASDRRARWEDYQTLTPAQKDELAARASASRPRASAENAANAAVRRSRPERMEASSLNGMQGKSNIVPDPALIGSLRTVSPTLVQAAPGTTTTLITRRPTPPAHQQTGLPKIAATPEFVNGSTLLPRRGAQGAAMEAPRATAGSAGRAGEGSRAPALLPAQTNPGAASLTPPSAAVPVPPGSTTLPAGLAPPTAGAVTSAPPTIATPALAGTPAGTSAPPGTPAAGGTGAGSAPAEPMPPSAGPSGPGAAVPSRGPTSTSLP